MNLQSRPKALVLLVVLVLQTLLIGPASALSPTEIESCFADAINDSRSIEGAVTLEFDVGLIEYARNHSDAMRAADDLFHSTSAQLAEVLPAGWTRWGENIGWASGGDVCSRLHISFMNSAGHRANILNPDFTRVVVGVIEAGGTTWVTVVFYSHPDSLVAGLPPFTDDDGSLHELDIIALADAGVTQGCGSALFCPDAVLTRGQMAAFLVRALSLPATALDYFSDDDGGPFEAEINALAAAGITSGCDVGVFCPEASLRRGQMAAFLARALELPSTPTDYFVDDAGEFESDINAVAAAGITEGCGPTLFCPSDVVTRAQMASFLVRALGL
ncbi:MAG: S-layer homology domain-containing protein [Acidimicrobiia bacterium]|nr:S-layer homology domain-containing protein [Acidimicrobiia bacterium]